MNKQDIESGRLRPVVPLLMFANKGKPQRVYRQTFRGKRQMGVGTRRASASQKTIVGLTTHPFPATHTQQVSGKDLTCQVQRLGSQVWAAGKC